jgi:YD repeat-containing protein
MAPTGRTRLVGKTMETRTALSEDGSRTDYQYDEAGLHVRTIDYDVDGALVWDIRYAYDAQGRVTGWTLYDRRGVLRNRWEVEYHSDRSEETRQYDAEGRWNFELLNSLMHPAACSASITTHLGGA